ncbi:hypothetical protein QFZ82_001835 [Streptomyces sp. V4I23]|uniref:nucleotidyl transferase AbiEii/AbiGii toxin family protein n=1 Tax=Streptomyces sp. V4I23 TaxID=3042282 RepID=UPI002787AA5D|nr:nucleotidyl transferase AbiEii/AbiGii toxin family protein [Streptomyces sp. V4I23]MDQ1007350.1 hypothetical protein [Streptomyces sp. V4I23]
MPTQEVCTVREARRAALDHVLRLIATAPWSGGLVLRGSMTLTAWLGPAAREPGDLDFIALEPASDSFPDPLSPFPHLDAIADVQQWPEAAHGAAAAQLWFPEGEFDTFGSRPVLPPEGLRWLGRSAYEPASPHEDLVAAVRADPHAAGGVLLDADGIEEDGNWTYREYETAGVRLKVPFRRRWGERGEIHIDFASDEVLPEAPVWTAVPQGDGGPPTPVPTASPALSLAWKLLWLCTDAAGDGVAGAKDLYDAVLLAESPRTRLRSPLLRKVLGEHAHGFAPDTVHGWQADWRTFRAAHPGVTGDLASWRDRLATALTPVCANPASP